MSKIHTNYITQYHETSGTHATHPYLPIGRGKPLGSTAITDLFDETSAITKSISGARWHVLHGRF